MKPSEYARMRELEDWYWWFVAKRTAVAAFISDAVSTTEPLRVLDAGCGTGAMLELFGTWPNVEASGTDSSPDALAYTRSRGHHRVVLGDLQQLPFESETFDVVTALDVIEHVEDDAHAVAELKRVLKPLGVLVATVPAYQFLWSPHDEALHHKRRYDAGSFRALLAGAGLDVERQTYRLCLLFPLAVAARLLSAAARRPSRGDPQNAAETNVPRVPKLLNWALIKLHLVELAVARRVGLPFGLSILAVGRKPAR